MTEPKPLDLDEFMIWIEKKQDEMYEKNGVIDIDELNEAIINEIKQRIRAACKFYLKYKDKPELLGKDHPLFIDKIDKMYRRRIEAEEALGPNYRPSRTLTNEYNERLFKEVFKDVLEEENDDRL